MKSPQISTLCSSDDKEGPELVIVIESDDKERYYFPYSQKDVNCEICMALDLIYEKPRYKPEPSEGRNFLSIELIYTFASVKELRVNLANCIMKHTLFNYISCLRFLPL